LPTQFAKPSEKASVVEITDNRSKHRQTIRKLGNKLERRKKINNRTENKESAHQDLSSSDHD
jgi:hypothetical protein